MLLTRPLTSSQRSRSSRPAAARPASSRSTPGAVRTPTLPQPESKTIPTVNVAPAKGWSGEQQPSAANGMTVTSYAADLDHPRWLYVLPNGDVLVAETNAPRAPRGQEGRQGLLHGQGAEESRRGRAERESHYPAARRGWRRRAEFRSVFLKDLNSPFGMALVGNDFYVANTDAVMRFRYRVARLVHRRTGHEGRGPAGGAAQPSLDQEPDRERPTASACTSRSARTATSPRTASRTRSAVPRFSRSIARRAQRGCSRRACAIRTVWIGSRRAARSGRRSTSATSSATISSPTT